MYLNLSQPIPDAPLGHARGHGLAASFCLGVKEVWEGYFAEEEDGKDGVKEACEEAVHDGAVHPIR